MSIKKYSKKGTRKTPKKAKKKTALKPGKKVVKKKAVKKKTAKRKTLKSSAKKIKATKTKDVSKTAEMPVQKRAVLDEKKEAIRKHLIQQREQIIKEAKTEISKYIKGETKQLVDTALDDGDWASVDLAEDVSLRQLGAHRETLLKIDAALRKLEEGTYGICEECGENISEERLKVIPFAVYCKDCKEKIEQLEAIEKEMP